MTLGCGLIEKGVYQGNANMHATSKSARDEKKRNKPPTANNPFPTLTNPHREESFRLDRTSATTITVSSIGVLRWLFVLIEKTGDAVAGVVHNDHIVYVSYKSVFNALW